MRTIALSPPDLHLAKGSVYKKQNSGNHHLRNGQFGTVTVMTSISANLLAGNTNFREIFTRPRTLARYRRCGPWDVAYQWTRSKVKSSRKGPIFSVRAPNRTQYSRKRLSRSRLAATNRGSVYLFGLVSVLFDDSGPLATRAVPSSSAGVANVGKVTVAMAVRTMTIAVTRRAFLGMHRCLPRHKTYCKLSR